MHKIILRVSNCSSTPSGDKKTSSLHTHRNCKKRVRHQDAHRYLIAPNTSPTSLTKPLTVPPLAAPLPVDSAKKSSPTALLSSLPPCPSPPPPTEPTPPTPTPTPSLPGTSTLPTADTPPSSGGGLARLAPGLPAFGAPLLLPSRSLKSIAGSCCCCCCRGVTTTAPSLPPLRVSLVAGSPAAPVPAPAEAVARPGRGLSVLVLFPPGLDTALSVAAAADEAELVVCLDGT